MYCRKCGARMSEQDRFCPECGTEASKGNTQQDELNGFPGNEQPQENPRMNKKTVIWIWILAAWILLIAIGISAFFIVKGQHVKKQYQSSLEAGDKYLENLDYADDWTWFDSDGNALSDESVSQMTTEEKAQAFLEGRYAKGESGQNAGPGRCGNLK